MSETKHQKLFKPKLMKYFLLTMIAQTMLVGCLCAQTAINSGFGSVEFDGGYQLDYSIGEMSNVTTIESTSSGILQQITQGFLQPQSPAASKPRAAILSFAKVSISPNPATERIQLQGNWNPNETVHCKIFNATGQVVWMQEIHGNTATFLLDQFLSGIYFLKLEVGGQSETLRFVKSN